MVDRYIVQARIAKIREYVALLRRIAKLADQKTFVKDPLVHGNAERYLQLTIQCVLDIANHAVADMKLRLPDDNSALFDVLAANKVIPVRLAAKLKAMSGFRNILVHEYLEIDRKQVYKAMKENLGDFEKFIRAVSKLL